MISNEEKIKQKKDTIKVKKQTVSHIFKYDINKVFNFIKDFEEHTKPLAYICSNIEILRGGKTYEKNTLFSLISREKIKIYIETDEIYESEDEKFLALKVIKSEPFHMEYRIKFRFFRLTENNSTLFLWDMIYYIPIKMQREQINVNNCERIIIIKLWEDYLTKKYGDFFKETQTIIINTEFRSVFRSLLNCNIFLKLIPSQIIKYHLDGEFYKEGTNIYLTCKGDKDIHLKVDKSLFNKEASEYEFEVFVMENQQNVKTLCNRISYKISKIHEKMTFMTFDHYIDFNIDKDYFEKILKHKKALLLDLKVSLENIKS